MGELETEKRQKVFRVAYARRASKARGAHMPLKAAQKKKKKKEEAEDAMGEKKRKKNEK